MRMVGREEVAVVACEEGGEAGMAEVTLTT